MEFVVLLNLLLLVVVFVKNSILESVYVSFCISPDKLLWQRTALLDAFRCEYKVPVLLP